LTARMTVIGNLPAASGELARLRSDSERGHSCPQHASIGKGRVEFRTMMRTGMSALRQSLADFAGDAMFIDYRRVPCTIIDFARAGTRPTRLNAVTSNVCS
jgi:hypothetical protein